MTELSEGDRRVLINHLKMIHTAQQQVELLRKPHDDAAKPYNDIINRLEGIKSELLEQAGVELYHQQCEVCDAVLFVGDLGHTCGDGPVLCAEHSPTWDDAKRQWEERAECGDLSTDEQEDYTVFQQNYAARLAAGTTSEKITYEL